MRKHKLERQYIFSKKKLIEIKQFLSNSEEDINLLQIVDEQDHTPIHHCAFHNYYTILKLYIQYTSKRVKKAQRDQIIKQWLNRPNKQGLNPVHYAAYKGHLLIIDLLKDNGANIYALTPSKVNALHLAAQTDHLETFIYYRDQLDINSLDQKGNTPLHQASHLGSSNVVSYLLAQKQIQLNQQNYEKQTPLHLAVTYGNTQIVKKLLLKGANRQIPDRKNELPIDIARNSEFKRIQKMLNNKYTCMERIQISCNKKMKYEPQKKTIKKPLIFIFLFLCLLALNNLFFIYEQGLQLITYVQLSVVGVILFLYVSLLFSCHRPPQLTQKYQKYLDQVVNICFDCNAYKPNRSLHCYICNKCTQVYDHHCPWINNCVGKHNIIRYYLFISLFFISLVYFLWYGILIMIGLFQEKNTLNPRFQSVPKGIYIIPGIINICIGLVLGTMILLLLLRQTKNLCLNKTTYQRFTKKNNSFVESRRPNRMQCRNCFAMCYGNTERQKSIMSETTDSLLDHVD